jgi:hypothetical protein
VHTGAEKQPSFGSNLSVHVCPEPVLANHLFDTKTLKRGGWFLQENTVALERAVAAKVSNLGKQAMLWWANETTLKVIRKTVFFVSTFNTGTDHHLILQRQARDKHRESSQKDPFSLNAQGCDEACAHRC